MAATLTAKLALDASGFTAGLTKAQAALGKLGAIGVPVMAAGFAAAASAAAGLAVGIKKAVDIGGALSELSARTGVAAGQLRVLQMAFERAGLSADQVGPAINKMQRAIIEAGQGSKTAQDALASLGLSVEQLSGLSPDKQFEAIGKAISGLSNPAAQAAAAMQIFGRSGGEMLALFKDSGALGDAARAIGSQAGLLTRNANLFDRASDILNTAGSKLEGFFVGVADKVIPAIMPILEKVDKLDFASIGQKLGKAVQFGLSAMTSGKVGELVGGEMKLAAINFTNSVYAGLRGALAFMSQYFTSYVPTVLGSALKNAFSGVGGFIGDATGKANVFGKMSDVVASALIYAALRWQQAMFDGVKAILGFYGRLWNSVTGANVKDLRSKLFDVVQFFASDFGKALQNPIAFIANKLASSLISAATDSAEVYKQEWDSGTGNFIEKAYAGLKGAAETARQNLGKSAQGLLDGVISAGSDNPLVSQQTLDLVAQQGKQLGEAFSKAVSDTGNIIDPTAAKNALERTRKQITQAATANESAVRAGFSTSKTIIPGMNGEGGMQNKNNTGIIAQSLQQVGGGAAFARFSDAANPAAQQLREQQKANGFLARIEQKLSPQMALMPA